MPKYERTNASQGVMQLFCIPASFTATTFFFFFFFEGGINTPSLHVHEQLPPCYRGGRLLVAATVQIEHCMLLLHPVGLL